MANHVPSSPYPAQSIAASTQSITNSVQGISLSTPNLTTQAALDNAIASLMSPTVTSGVQVISSGGPTQSMCQTQNNLSNALLKSVTLVKRSVGDNATGEFHFFFILFLNSEKKNTKRKWNPPQTKV